MIKIFEIKSVIISKANHLASAGLAGDFGGG
jgi:hypothetical protein